MAVDEGGGADEEMIQCSEHPFNNSSPGGGICAFCLQDKLGKLVSNSSSSSFLPNSPSSFRSDLPSSSSSSSTVRVFDTTSVTRPPFLFTHKTKTMSGLVLNRSKSTTHYNTNININNNDYSTPTVTSTTTPRRRGFWSFLHLPHKKTPPTPSKVPTAALGPSTSSVQLVVVEEDTDSSANSSTGNVNSNGVSNTTSFERKVTRSRSVGCGSRSFSGDLFDRISTGFGDCALRRVESHRHSTSTAMREKPRCGGLFGGFMMIASTSSSTSTTSSSSYWAAGGDSRPPNGRTRSWGWALASPRRVFGSKPAGIPKKEIGNGETTTTTIITSTSTTATATTIATMTTSNGGSDNSKKTPNLADIPSLLSVRN